MNFKEELMIFAEEKATWFWNLGTNKATVSQDENGQPVLTMTPEFESIQAMYSIVSEAYAKGREDQPKKVIELLDENDRLRGEVEFTGDLCDANIKTVDDVLMENKRLRAALEKIANEDEWTGNSDEVCLAKEALGWDEELDGSWEDDANKETE